MLKKKNRLKKKEVDFIFKKGKTRKSGFLILKFVKNERASLPRFSVIIPVKVSKKSTKRNKIKRQIRESLRKKIENIKRETDGIVMVLPEVLDKSYKEIDKEVEELLKEAEILK